MVNFNLRELALPRACTVSSPALLAACASTGAVAVAAGASVELFAVDGVATLRPLQQLALEHDGAALTATCACFAAPGVLLVAAVDAVTVGGGSWLLGFRVFVGATRSPAHWSFAEPLSGTVTRITPSRHCGGAALLLLEGAGRFGVFQWRERLSDRRVSVAQLPGAAAAGDSGSDASLVAAALSADGCWCALADATGRLFLLTFMTFDWGYVGVGSCCRDTAGTGGKRLQGGRCSRAGIVMRDNPLDVVRLMAVTGGEHVGNAGVAEDVRRVADEDASWWAGPETQSVCSSLRWLVMTSPSKSRHLLLVGTQSGSLSVRTMS